MFTFSVLAMLPFTNGAFSKVCSDYYKEMMELSVASNVIGGALMGLGMTVSGSVVFYTATPCFVNGPNYLRNSYSKFGLIPQYRDLPLHLQSVITHILELVWFNSYLICDL